MAEIEGLRSGKTDQAGQPDTGWPGGTRQLGILPTRALFFLDSLQRIAVRPILDLEACDGDLFAQPIRLGPVLGFSCGQTRIAERFDSIRNRRFLGLPLRERQPEDPIELLERRL